MYRPKQRVALSAAVALFAVAQPAVTLAQPRALERKQAAAPRFYRGAGPVATHRFWSQKNWVPLDTTAEGGPYWMFPEPLAVQTTSGGLRVGSSRVLNVEPTFFTHPVQPDFTLATTDAVAPAVAVVRTTDRMVDLDFGSFQSRLGRGMPFVYLSHARGDVTVTFTAPPQVFAETGGTLGVQLGENLYGLFCPTGGAWSHAGLVFTCHKTASQDYFSAAVLPARGDLSRFRAHAFTVPTQTEVHWDYREQDSVVETTFSITTEQKEGRAPAEGMLQALYPHQYASLVGTTADATRTWTSARGPMRLLAADRFTTRDAYAGLLPFLPVAVGADRAEVEALAQKFAGSSNPVVSSDTYNTGKSLNRAAQVLPLLARDADRPAAQRLAAAVQAEFARWQGAPTAHTPGFVYDARWSTFIGYPAAFGSETQLNDHHFHYGYWLQAAAMLGMTERAWLTSAPVHGLLHELAGDIANIDPARTRYPLLRHFDAYAGHSWASGQAPFGDGQNEESSSEAVNAWAGLALYATEIGDRPLRDAAIWMLTLERNAAADYWFNSGPVSTFPAGFRRVQVANLFDGKADAATWFGDAPEYEHGIEFLPFTGASLYLGRSPKYVRDNLAEVLRLTGGGIRTQSTFWPDLMEMYEGLVDPRHALEQWRRTPFVFDGETKAHQLAWLTSLAVLGEVDDSVHADTPLYAVFRKDGKRTHVAFNVRNEAIEVRFSDGARVSLPGNSYCVESAITPLRLLR